MFPVGAFAYSEGLETAAVRVAPQDAAASGALLRAWLDVSVDESIGRLEGPAVWLAWRAFQATEFDQLAVLDEELTALRPSASARRSSRAMGLRLVTTWHVLHPDSRLEETLTRARQGTLGPALPIAFAGACACSGVAQRAAVEAFAYTRLAATVSAAMRLMPIGQTAAHALLSNALERVP